MGAFIHSGVLYVLTIIAAALCFVHISDNLCRIADCHIEIVVDRYFLVNQ